MTRQRYSPQKEHDKGKHFLSQKRRVFEAFLRSPATMKMVSDITGIDRANICWFVKQFQQAGTIRLIHDAKCKITGAYAGYYQAISAYNPQLQLF